MPASKIRAKAKELAQRPYTLLVFLDKTTDGEPVYVAINPELDGCVAQGESVQEAQANLDECRIDLIEHLLEHELPVPEPVGLDTSAGVSSAPIIVDRSVHTESPEYLLTPRLRTNLPVP